MTSIGNKDQSATITTLLQRFGCEESDVRQIDAFDLPEGYVSVIIGERKGRPIAIGVSNEGRAST